MSRKALISIIIPVYNVEKYIEKCIYSVINNDLEINDYEIIVIDDQSPDNSLSIVQNIEKKHSNIKVISQQNKGLGGARNTGILNATGDYLLFLDSDDWYLPSTLKNLINVAVQNRLDVLEFGAQGINEKNEIIYQVATTSNGQVMNGIDYYQKIRYMDSSCNKLYKRNFLVNNALFFLEKIYIEDYEFNTRAFCLAQRVMAIDTIIGQFFQSMDSITRNIDESKKNKMLQDIVFVIKSVNKMYKIGSHKEEAFFKQRLGFLVATLFYQMVKNKMTYSKFVEMKKELSRESIFFVNYPIFDKKKNIFRIIFLKNFYLFRLIKIF